MESVDHYDSLAMEYHHLVQQGHGSTVHTRTDRQVEIVNEILEGKQHFIEHMVKRFGSEGVVISTGRGTVVRSAGIKGSLVMDMVGESNAMIIEKFHTYDPSKGGLNTFIMLQIANGLHKSVRYVGPMNVGKSRLAGASRISYESIDDYARDLSSGYHDDSFVDDASVPLPKPYPGALVTLPDSSYESRDFVRKVRGAIALGAERLSPKERRVLLSRAGIEKKLSLRALSEEMGVSHESIRLIERQAKEKLWKQRRKRAYLPLQEVHRLYGLELK